MQQRKRSKLGASLALLLVVCLIASVSGIHAAVASEEGSESEHQNQPVIETTTTPSVAAPKQSTNNQIGIMAATYGWDGSTLTINGHVEGNLGAEIAGASSVISNNPAAVKGFVVNGGRITPADWRAFRGGSEAVPTGAPQAPYPNVETVDLGGSETTSLAYFDVSSNNQLQPLPITTFTLPSLSTQIGYGALAQLPNLKTLNNTSKLTVLQTYALAGSGLTSVNLPNVETIDTGSFGNSPNLASVQLPKLTHIYNSLADAAEANLTGAFRGCTSLTEVSFPLVQTVGWSAFKDCTSLKTVDLPQAKTFGRSVFLGCSALAVAYLPKAESFAQESFNACSSLSLAIFGAVPTFEKSTLLNTEFDGVSPTAVALYSSGDPAVFNAAAGWQGGTAHYVSMPSVTVPVGSPAKFVFITEGSVGGDPANTSKENIPSYLNITWEKDGEAIAGDTKGTLSFNTALVTDSGTYKPVAHNTSATPGSWSLWPSVDLSVTEVAARVVTTGGTWVYDGEDHGATVAVTGLPEGYTFTAISNAHALAVTGLSPLSATCDSLAIYNADGVDVTELLDPVFVDGTIEITPATLAVTTPDATKVYDGTPLTAAGSIRGLVDGETVTFATTGEQTAVGSSANSYSLVWDGTAQESNYKVVADIGRLTVTSTPTPGNGGDGGNGGNGGNAGGSGTGGTASTRNVKTSDTTPFTLVNIMLALSALVVTGSLVSACRKKVATSTK